MDEAELTEAVAAAQAGDEDGFRLLWRAHQPRLLRYLSIRDSSEAEDLAAETWLRVARELHRFRGDAADFRSWLFTIARNLAHDVHRARRRRPQTGLPNSAFVNVADPGETDALAFDRLSLQRCLDLLRQLPPDQADAVALRILAGLDVARVAQLLGKREGAVRVATHRGLRTLADRLGVAPRPVRV